MTPRTRARAAGVALTTALVLFLGACGGDDEVDIDASSSAESPSAAASTDADGYTPEEREAIDAVDAYRAAVFDRGDQPIEESLEGTVTDELYAAIVPDEQAITEDAGKWRIGEATFEPESVTIDGDEAVVTGCMDTARSFIVDAGDTEVRGAATGGMRTPLKVTLERGDDTWLVATPETQEGSC
ncbi:hypothetical protein CLV56_0298 [Mumia flava]|uniref:Uncharacterized protein n=1 Tax=Mumia flava TaxID=1348852 RepID=A0A0B2AYL8_9ACTN|nr:hypothetical protein [Mumia flava]PJJ56094.1 hypothetical protein CLV56_0298 [Mumia flava]